jgi:bifunctional UDP-N-acetylglucosamine pyrophosphorylase / glucosamine-1-phosphate N-acetyltransferase
MNIVVLAAGRGKRMNSDLPKVLHRLAGRALLTHVVDCARSLAPKRLVVVYGHGGEAVPLALPAADLIWVKQIPQLGTGHAVLQAMPFLDDSVPTLVLSGDVPLIRADSLARLLAATGADKLGVLTIVVPDPTGYGRIVRDGGRVCGIVEHKDAGETLREIHEINTGIMVAPTVPLKRWLARLSNRNAQGEYYLTDIVASAVADGVEVVAAQPSDLWETLGVNNKTQLAQLERIYQRNLAEKLMGEGVTLADPARIDVRGTLACGRDVSIDVGCVFEGKVVIGDGATIGAHCVISDCKIDAGAQILAFTHMDQAIIGAAARVGPYARLRPGADLGTEVHIGNFVEVKASTIAAYSKANHLAYIGDAVVGERVNIGAGTIVCNYDGANKHVTIIEDDVHIGSDTQLVAPVKVGAGSTVGAGTTVWKDVPPNSLVINTKDQVTRKGWRRPAKLKKAS